MPLARIDVNKDAPPERIKVVSEAIYSAMFEIAKVPLHDKFQVVTRHADDEIFYPKEGYLGLTYTSDLISIQITWIGLVYRSEKEILSADSRRGSRAGARAKRRYLHQSGRLGSGRLVFRQW